MIVDTSIIGAIFIDGNEEEADHYARVLAACERPKIHFGTLVECYLIVWLRRPQHVQDLLAFLDFYNFEIIDGTLAMAELAFEGIREHGKGNGKVGGARLNFGDIFSYTAAKALDEPLLFKGDDFGKSDVKIAEGSNGP